MLINRPLCPSVRQIGEQVVLDSVQETERGKQRLKFIDTDVHVYTYSHITHTVHILTHYTYSTHTHTLHIHVHTQCILHQTMITDKQMQKCKESLCFSLAVYLYL